jgi:hypothetical protein
MKIMNLLLHRCIKITLMVNMASVCENDNDVLSYVQLHFREKQRTEESCSPAYILSALKNTCKPYNAIHTCSLL